MSIRKVELQAFHYTGVRMEEKILYRKDYQPPPWLVDRVDLYISLAEDGAVITSRLACRRNPETGQRRDDLVLPGEDLELIAVSINGVALTRGDYRLSSKDLIIPVTGDMVAVEVITRMDPAANTALEGLYLSSGNYCTQCEAEGFRRITYFPDRPDVMACFTTTIEADNSVPVLLAGGNLVGSGRKGNGRHWVKWDDPFPKPSYLFAMVAGNLVRIADSYQTSSGRLIDLHIYVEGHNRDRCGHAMDSLKRAMAWEEEVFGLEYDLDLYMIVAVDDFNMGAMENKGLNVFNSKYVLARPETATDDDYAGIEAVIAHEYFHNWTGNRVTCRDWFQLSLKEGLTVFRDQMFSADMGSAAVKRIRDVQVLRENQFPEDSGPMAHPIRPDSYIEINNFYTSTVYNKGAEVIRMIHVLLGPMKFRQGMDLYFERHDGSAVTCDDFVRAMEDGGGVDLAQFRNWYRQAGTPELKIRCLYDEGSARLKMTVSQSCPPTPGQNEKKPFHLPLVLGLLDGKGRPMPVQIAGSTMDPAEELVVEVVEGEQEFILTGVTSNPVPSLLRGFSAPVRLDYPYQVDELCLLVLHDSDSFTRWQAGRILLSRLLIDLAERGGGQKGGLDPDIVHLYRKLLDRAKTEDMSLIAEILLLPSERYLAQEMKVIDPAAIHVSRAFVKNELGRILFADFHKLYQETATSTAYYYNAGEAGRRRLGNACLSFMVAGGPEGMELARRQFDRADNMTDVQAAFKAIVHGEDGPGGQEVIEMFRRRWQDDPLVMDKWFAVQATAAKDGTLARVRDLLDHPAFSLTNPNKVRSLIGAFASLNQYSFHGDDGMGYVFLADQVVEVDRINPQIAARLVTPLGRWQRFDLARQQLMKRELQRILAVPEVSRDVYEIVSKSLA